MLALSSVSKSCGSLRRLFVSDTCSCPGTAPTVKHEDRRDSAQVCLFSTEHCYNLESHCLDREQTVLWCCRSDSRASCGGKVC